MVDAATNQNTLPESGTPPVKSSGLIGKIERAAPPSTPPTSPSEGSTTPSNSDQWFWDDGMPGSGPRPAWLDTKYKSVSEKAKAHTEAEKRLGSLGQVPENYDLEPFKEKLNPEDAHMRKILETAKKGRVDQSTLHELLNTFVDYEQAKLPNTDAEIAKLGPNAQAKIDVVRNWAANNLSEQACETLGKIGNTAEVINFIDEIRQAYVSKGSQPPAQSDTSQHHVRMTQEDIDAELKVPENAQRYLNDPKYRQQIQDKLKLIYGED